MKAGGSKEWRCMEGHRTLGCVENEQLTPAEPQQSYLVGDLKVREEGYVPCPLHGTEQQTSGHFADVLDSY